jgi:hypothetical protein
MPESLRSGRRHLADGEPAVGSKRRTIIPTPGGGAASGCFIRSCPSRPGWNNDRRAPLTGLESQILFPLSFPTAAAVG